MFYKGRTGLKRLRRQPRLRAMLCLGALGFTAYGAAAQSITSKDPVHLTMAPTDKLGGGQVYQILPSQFLRTLAAPLTGAGIVVAASSDAVRLVVEVETYDSGPYLGFSKTARIAVNYRLQSPGAAALQSWSDRCEAKASVDLQDAPDRNRTAVSLCLTMLGARLAEKLVGPSPEVMVR
jgi:hypothetical protein